MSIENNLLRPTWIEEDYDILRNNVRHIKELVGEKARLICVVKGNAYGCGLRQTVQALDQEDVYGFGTGNIYEAIEVRKLTPRPILLFGNTLTNAIPEIIEYNITPSVSDWAWVMRYSECAQKPVPIFVKVDVGANRLGVPYEEAVDFIRNVSQLPNIMIEGIHTHIPWNLAEEGVSKITEISQQLEEQGIHIPIKMTANSELTARLPSSWLNAINPGKLVYGIYPCEVNSLSVQPVFKTLKSKIIHIKKPIGESLKQIDRIGIVPVGFADGLPSAYITDSYVLVHGKRAPIIKIHAEHTRVDLTGIDEAEVSDEVVIIGVDGQERITAGELAHKCAMTESELLRNLAHCIPSVCTMDGQSFILNPISTKQE